MEEGVSKDFIAKATKFSIEYIDSLLERFYPEPKSTNNLDIQSQIDFLKQQIENLKKNLDNKEFENIQLRQQIQALQTKVANMSNNNEPIQVELAVQQWEYMSTSKVDMENLNRLGEQGWEVVDGIRMCQGTETVFKQPKQKSQKKTNDYGYGR